MEEKFLTPEDLAEHLTTLLRKYEKSAAQKGAFDWLDASDVLQILKINSTKTLLTLHRKGLLGRTKLAGRYYYRRSEIEKLMEHNYKKVNFKSK